MTDKWPSNYTQKALNLPHSTPISPVYLHPMRPHLLTHIRTHVVGFRNLRPAYSVSAGHGLQPSVRPVRPAARIAHFWFLSAMRCVPSVGRVLLMVPWWAWPRTPPISQLQPSISQWPNYGAKCPILWPKICVCRRFLVTL